MVIGFPPWQTASTKFLSSIFAMKYISNEAVSHMNKEEVARDKVTNASMKHHLFSNKWKPKVPEDAAVLIKYFQWYVNVLHALIMGQNPHWIQAKQIVGKLNRSPSVVCKAMQREVIASIIWATLKEARISFMGSILWAVLRSQMCVQTHKNDDGWGGLEGHGRPSPGIGESNHCHTQRLVT